MKVYDTIGAARRQMALADLVPNPTTDPVFMAAARAAVIAGGNIPWSDLPGNAEADKSTTRPSPNVVAPGSASRD